MKVETRIYVWDVFVRLFHWVLVLCIFLNYFLTEEGEKPHAVIGYIAAGFVTVRFIWGFFGSYYARFSTWLASPGTVFRYLRNFKSRRVYMSHNPIAGWMMIFLMLCVIGLGLTGFMMGTDRFFGEEWVERLHDIIADVMMAAVVIHVLGALYESYHEKQNLVAGMIHGYKKDRTN
ncbi:cytochrome b/b6 domain-containing protein [Bdellovibrio sp. HCB-162]|uniref:cytochrome b/b6 domain-containing protein n=1 Tax=Bdellovibrio sp. HCB-162 TaxID=3394234 RepID=UPI0039BCA9B5